MRIVLSVVLCVLGAGDLASGGQVSAARYSHLARGVNLTRWFQYGSPQPITTADRDLLAQAGFTWVRIAVAPQYLLPRWSTRARIAKNLADLDAGIDLFLEKGMAVMLDFQADSEYLNYYLGNQAAPGELIDTWRMLAARYANRDPELLFFEIMNEPDNRFTEEVWDAEQERALTEIRKAAPEHTVLLTPVNWSELDALLRMTPYNDPNVIYVLHYYLPIAFTHQGATWTGSPGIASLRNVRWPAFLADGEQSDAEAAALLRQYREEDWDAGRIEWDMELAAAWAKHWHVQVVVNEFGGFKPFSPPDSRAQWTYDVRRAIEKQHLGWAMWDYAAGFDLTLLQNGMRIIDPEVSAALGLRPWSSLAPSRQSLPVFSGMRTVQIGGQPDADAPEGILASDLNGDGLDDVIVTPVESPVRFFLNSGRGILEPGHFEGKTPASNFVSAMAAGRFDRSGRQGFFLSDRIGRSRLLLPSGGDSLTDATGNLPAEISSTRGAVAVKGDGRPDDLIVFEPRVRLLRNDGTGHFRLDPDAFAKEQARFECGAMAGADLLAFGASGARVLKRDGGGEPLPFPQNGGGPVIGGCAVIADLNRDGKPDAIVAYRNDIIQILMNNGDGTYRDETAARMEPLPASKGGLRRISLVPANSGNNFALVVTRVGEAPLIRVERGDGVFADSGVKLTAYPWVVAPGNFNGDGLPDLVFGQGGRAPLLGRFGQAPLQSRN